ncbi:hypothetical protein GVAV_002473 [Gurleya vavrai]
MSNLFKCEFPDCNKTYNKKSRLAEHNNTHTQTRPFQCPKCPKCYYKRYHLQRHFLTHSGEKAYVCEDCGSGHYEKSKLREHKKRCGRKFVCQDCSRVFIREGRFKTHLCKKKKNSNLSNNIFDKENKEAKNFSEKNNLDFYNLDFNLDSFVQINALIEDMKGEEDFNLSESLKKIDIAAIEVLTKEIKHLKKTFKVVNSLLRNRNKMDGYNIDDKLNIIKIFDESKNINSENVKRKRGRPRLHKNKFEGLIDYKNEDLDKINNLFAFNNIEENEEIKIIEDKLEMFKTKLKNIQEAENDNTENFENKVFECMHCDKKYMSKKSLSAHIETLHVKNKKHFCKCGKEYFYKHNLKQHESKCQFIN